MNPLKGMDLKNMAPLLMLLPIAAKQGGQGAVSALMAGWQRGQARRQQQQQQQGQQDFQNQRLLQGDQRQADYQQAQIANMQAQQANLTADNARQDQVAKDALWKQFLDRVATVTDPDREVPQLVDAYSMLGLRRPALEAQAMQLISPSSILQREAQAKLDEIDKRLQAHDPSYTAYVTNGYPFQVKSGKSYTREELQAIAGTGALDPATGQPAKYVPPPAEKPTDRRGFTSKDVTVNGARKLLNYDADTGQYYERGSTVPVQGDIQDYRQPTSDRTDTRAARTQAIADVRDKLKFAMRNPTNGSLPRTLVQEIRTLGLDFEVEKDRAAREIERDAIARARAVDLAGDAEIPTADSLISDFDRATGAQAAPAPPAPPSSAPVGAVQPARQGRTATRAEVRKVADRLKVSYREAQRQLEARGVTVK